MPDNNPKHDPKAPTKPSVQKPRDNQPVKHRKAHDEDELVDSGELPDIIPGGEGQERAANTPENEDDEVRQGT